MPKSGAIVLVLTLLQAPALDAQSDIRPVAEYPPQDVSLAFLVTQGLMQADAAARFQRAPADIETLRALMAAGDIHRAIRSLRQIVADRPERMADAAEAVAELPYSLRGDDETTLANAVAVRQILADARAKLPGLPREDAARAERIFMQFDAAFEPTGREWAGRLADFVTAYSGTRTALLAEVDLIANGGISWEVFDALDAFVAAHPGSEAAAKALYTKGFHSHTINTLGRLDPRGADPTARFLRVLDVVQELESGRYPASEWTAKAPSLVTGFDMPDGVHIAPENIDLLIQHFTDFARAHFTLSEHPDADRDGIGYVVTSKLAELYARHGERDAGVERTFAELERTVADSDSVRLLRGLFYLQTQAEETADERRARLDRAREMLRSVSAAGGSLTHRRALATLAALEFQEGRDATARTLFERYARRYPDSPWTWVARIRIGQSLESEDRMDAAAAAYQEAADRHDLPMARVLGAAYAARMHEAAGRFTRALALHGRALASWDNAFGLTYRSNPRRGPLGDPMVPRPDTSEVRKDLLASRVEELGRTLSAPGGSELETGRALFARERYDDAARELDRMIAAFPDSPLRSEARELANRARVEAALRIAADGRRDRGQPAAFEMLQRVTGEPLDAAVTAARIMRSALLLLDGREADAETLLGEALEEWHTRQPVKRPSDALEEDVAQIRRAVFLPRGGGVYSEGRWNAFSWPESAPPYMVVNSDVTVTLHDGEAATVSITEPLPGAGRVVFFDTGTIGLLRRMLYELGGTERREPRRIMETPNQPVGDSMRILGLWQRFFPARPGHWGGWELETYPVITGVRFLDETRTKAAANVTIGYSGATVELEKQDGRWVARRLTNWWIT